MFLAVHKFLSNILEGIKKVTKINVYFLLDWTSLTVRTNYIVCLQYLDYIMGPLCLRITEFEFSASVFENTFLASIESILNIEVIEM